MKRFLFLLVAFGLWQSIACIVAGVVACDASCISKLASLSTLALNADKAVSGSKKAIAVVKDPLHPKRALARLRATRKDTKRVK